MNKLLNILIHPFVLSLLITLLIIFMTPDIFKKYKIQLTGMSKQIDETVYFKDLDGDGYDEYINAGYSDKEQKFPFLQLSSNFTQQFDYTFLNQINLRKHWPENVRFYFHDYNKDQKLDIVFFQQSNDSLFLLAADPFTAKLLFDKFVAHVNFRDNSPDFVVHDIFFADLNNDGHEEAVFTVMGGYSGNPRSLFAYDFFNDSLREKDLRYANLEIRDIYKDKVTNGSFILLSGTATQNFANPGDEYYSDLKSYLMVLNANFKHVFNPISYSSGKLQTFIDARFAVELKESLAVYSYFITYSPDSTNILYKISLDGQVLDKSKLGKGRKSRLGVRKNKPGKPSLIVFTEGKEVYFISPELKIVRTYFNPDIASLDEFICYDFDRNGKPELIAADKNKGKLFLFDDRLRTLVETDFPVLVKGRLHFFCCHFRHWDANLIVKSESELFFYEFRQNPKYYFKYPVYAGIFVALALFFTILLRIQKRSLQKKYEQEKYLTELELLTIKNQIDPHFTFNAINTLSSVIFDRDKKSAHQFLVELSSVIRNSLRNSREIAVTLKDELDFVKNYLHIQQFRHDFVFDFEIETQGKVDYSIQIPKMIIQTFAENAVKHGLVPRKEKGKLMIRLSQEIDHLHIVVQDDGVGRQAAKNMSNRESISTGKGLEIIDQVIKLYEKLKNVKVTYHYEDLTENGQVAGTRVVVRAPFQN